MKPRARDLGIEIGRLPTGPANAITDVEGVRVGHTTLIEGAEVRTGVTVVLPPGEPLFAGAHRINGNGELTGLEWVRDSGLLTTPVALTNTHSVGVVRDALVEAAAPGEHDWSLPVVGETWDGFLNDINGFHVRAEHVAAALERASGGAVEEGAVGGGTGMVCHGFKGGIGTSSRVVEDGWTLGALVQANHGRRPRLRVDGVPVGERIGSDRVPLPETPEGAGSIIVCSRPTRRSSPASASGSRDAPASGSPARAAWASARAATSPSASRRGIAASTPTGPKCRCGC